ncbi:MAG: hypothetical protein CM1200mP39_28120 [Dehalococcoidia bacterium]|nr:MAG: hypothetical protein CM1200mP39_28120 [Dehalococcoidia bacterium]
MVQHKNLNTDLRALWPEKKHRAKRISNAEGCNQKKKSLAAAHAIENGTPATRRRRGEIFMKRVLGPDDIDEVTQSSQKPRAGRLPKIL